MKTAMMTKLREEQAKHPAGSDLQKLLCWAELHIGDQFDRICELEEDLKAMDSGYEKRANALNQIRGLLNATSQYILDENFDIPIDLFAKDFAPFKNVMAAHGVEPYAKKTKRGKKNDA